MEAENVKEKAVSTDSIFPDSITLVTYNVDGLESDNLKQRFQSVIDILITIKPDIILLQEVVDAHMDLIEKELAPHYHVIVPKYTTTYYTVTFVSKIIINSHLESLKDKSRQRKEQLTECLQKMERNLDQNTLVIFGGDLNIREYEVPKLRPEIKDAWIAGGSNEDTKYTWDCQKNRNKPHIPRSVRCRFDRIYFSGPYKRVDFSLAGNQTIPNKRCFPSDHFAVLCKFWDPTN
uniref:Endonuclease/exonuclease/phosphatase domain-containing protein n=1 Tax=Panagrolaimus sp. PS1159 TaxID=55785 RepID=A0AC35EWL0_9BILA